MLNQPFAAPALLLFIAAVPLLFGLIPRNRFYGVRTTKTMSDEKIWYAVNRLAALAVMAGSIIYTLVAMLIPYNRLAADNFSIWAVHLAAFAGPIAIGLPLAARAKKPKRQ